MTRQELRVFEDEFLKGVVDILELPESFKFKGQKVDVGTITREQRSLLYELVYSTTKKRQEYNESHLGCIKSSNDNWCEQVLERYFGIKL